MTPLSDDVAHEIDDVIERYARLVEAPAGRVRWRRHDQTSKRRSRGGRVARVRFEYLSESDKQFFHEQVVRVLEEVGVAYNTPTLTSLLAEAGATVDAERMTARIPWDLVERCLGSCRSRSCSPAATRPTTAASATAAWSTRVTAPRRTCSTT